MPKILDRNITINSPAVNALQDEIKSFHNNAQSSFDEMAGILSSIAGVCARIPAEAREPGLVSLTSSFLGKLQGYSFAGAGSGRR